MSDIADDAQGVAELGFGGARFQTRRAAVERKQPTACHRCGSNPVYVVAERSREILQCPQCGNSTEALGSRQRLIEQWNGINS